MNLVQTLSSSIDASVNFIFDNDMEARFVQRTPDYYIVYLSSQTGCNKACKYCHLTRTKQVSMVHATITCYLTQLENVLWYVNSVGIKAPKLHVNFMARGEPLSNPIFRSTSLREELFKNLTNSCENIVGITPEFKVSTILPYESPSDFRTKYPVEIYYSWYTFNKVWKKRWMPSAIRDEQTVASILLNYWRHVPIRLHGPFIKDENDNVRSIKSNLKYLYSVIPRFRFNIVRYNPYDGYGEEATEERLLEIQKTIEDIIGKDQVKVIPRVGTDVKASCGMFIEQEHEIIKEARQHFNEIIITASMDLQRLIGVEETDEDYYYIFKGMHGDIELHSAVGSFCVLKEKLPEYKNIEHAFNLNDCPPERSFIYRKI